MATHSILVTIPFIVAIMVVFPASTALATLPTPTRASLAAAPEPNMWTPGPAMAPSSEPTAYDMLQRYNLPRGILPEGVTGYVLRQDGSFEVYLPSDCNLRAGSIKVRYSSTITGNIHSQSISDINGVHVKELFAWIEISKVESDGSQLHFFAGPISKSFSMDTFANIQQCN